MRARKRSWWDFHCAWCSWSSYGPQLLFRFVSRRIPAACTRHILRSSSLLAPEERDSQPSAPTKEFWIHPSSGPCLKQNGRESWWTKTCHHAEWSSFSDEFRETDLWPNMSQKVPLPPITIFKCFSTEPWFLGEGHWVWRNGVRSRYVTVHLYMYLIQDYMHQIHINYIYNSYVLSS